MILFLRIHKMRCRTMWRRGRSYAQDLRSRVLAAVDGGMAVRQAAPLFRVSVSYIYKALIRRRATGDSNANRNRGHRPRKLSPEQEAALAARGSGRSRTSRWPACRTGSAISTASG